MEYSMTYVEGNSAPRKLNHLLSVKDGFVTVNGIQREVREIHQTRWGVQYELYPITKEMRT